MNCRRSLGRPMDFLNNLCPIGSNTRTPLPIILCPEKPIPLYEQAASASLDCSPIPYQRYAPGGHSVGQFLITDALSPTACRQSVQCQQGEQDDFPESSLDTAAVRFGTTRHCQMCIEAINSRCRKNLCTLWLVKAHHSSLCISDCLAVGRSSSVSHTISCNGL